MTPSNRVPAALQPKFDAIALATDAFCDQHLNDEYKQLIRQVLATLCRKRPSPLLVGKENSWAAGAVHAMGFANFLFDPAQSPHCKATDIWTHFGLGTSTGQSHSKKIRDALDIGQADPHWTLPGRMEDNPMVWMVQVNGFIADVRNLPLEAQEAAFAKGLIPYVPARKTVS